MAGRAIEELLAPFTVQAVLSRTRMPGTTISQLLGCNVGAGPVNGAMMLPGNDTEGDFEQRGNTVSIMSRSSQYDYFDITRDIAEASAPDSPSTAVKPQKAGAVQFTVPRSASNMTLNFESMNNMRSLGGPVSSPDRMGVNYIRHQNKHMGQRVANLVEFQCAAMLRGIYYFVQDGDKLYHSFTSGGGAGEVTIDYKIPASHKSQLDMLGVGSIVDTSWDDLGADIPAQLYAINSAELQETGQGISHVVCSSVVMNYVVQNTAVKGLAGTFEPFQYLEQKNSGEFSLRLKGIPWITWHVVDYGLDVWTPGSSAKVFTKMIPDTAAVFLPEIDSSWVTYGKYGETVTEGPNGATGWQEGFYTYAHPIHDPGGWKLYTLLNGFPLLPIPKAVSFGTVVF